MNCIQCANYQRHFGAVSSTTAYLKTTLTDTFASGIQTTRTLEGDDFKEGTLTLADGTPALQSSVVRDSLARVTDSTVGSQSHSLGYKDEDRGQFSFDSALSAMECFCQLGIPQNIG